MFNRSTGYTYIRMHITDCVLHWYWDIVVDKRVWRIKLWQINENSLCVITFVDMYIPYSGNFSQDKIFVDFCGWPKICELGVLVVLSHDCGKHPQKFHL